ncbi:BQ2448_7341 [Microbotryum intermedium]|uniref:BQ2448_7341 protein n=1 Tax=Microbotryum intermedium TaxID=269621 RepID=A0A238FJU3_9BASI|nr:BQ2448_7341 [Microbotryum intermedium]
MQGLQCKRLDKSEPADGVEAIRTRFRADQEQLGVDHGIVSGKWSSSHPTSDVDFFFAKVVEALADPSGALAATGKCHKVSASGKNDDGNHVILVSCDNSTRACAGPIFKALVKQCAVLPEMFVPDIFLLLDLDVNAINPSPFDRFEFMPLEEVVEALSSHAAGTGAIKDTAGGTTISGIPAEAAPAQHESQPTRPDASKDKIEPSANEEEDVQRLTQRFADLVQHFERVKIQVEETSNQPKPETMKRMVEGWLVQFEGGKKISSLEEMQNRMTQKEGDEGSEGRDGDRTGATDAMGSASGVGDTGEKTAKQVLHSTLSVLSTTLRILQHGQGS